MKNINTASLDCGIDGVNIKFLSEFETEQELYYFQRSNSNRTIKYGLLKKLGLKNGLVEYSIFINLPQTIRNSNIQPYSFVDCTKYMRVYQMLTEQLNDIFDFDISDLKVTGIECSFSYTLRDNTLLQPMLNYICRAFISKNTPLHVYVKGTQSRRYKKSKIYCDCINVQSFRTSRSSDCLDIYNQLPAIAKQAKRALTAQKRKKKIERLPEPPTLLSLNELAIKTGLSYQFLRKMIVEEKHVPYIKVGNKYIVNYELFLHKLGNMEG